MKKILFLIAFIPFVSISQMAGDWYTSFVVMGTVGNMKMEIVTSDPSSIHLFDLDRGNEPQKMDIHKIERNKITFEWSAIGLKFEGEYFPDESKIRGTFYQRGIDWEASFTKERKKDIVLIRPQDPKGPFEYKIEEVLIENKDNVIGATLTLPKDFSEETPIVVLASGSGPQNRDCEIMGHKPFWVIADHLAKNGIACLRFDDRGVGKSTGNFAETDLKGFGSDVESCVRYLRKQRKFKKNKIGLAGHSEGGIHTLIAARSYKKVDFIMQLSSVGTNGGQVLIEQQYLIPIQSEATEEDARWNQSVYIGLVDIIASNDEKEAADLISEFLGQKYEEASEEFKSETDRMSFILGIGGFLNNDWGRSFIAFNTADYLKKIRLPLFAATGDKDVQVPAESNLAVFKSYRRASAQVSTMGGLNHLMQTCKTCSIMEYGELEETFSVVLMDMMVKWIHELK